MCKLSLLQFIKNGASVFSDALNGRYCSHSEEINKIKEDLLNNESSMFDDKRNLYGDRQKISKDVRNSLDKLISISNG